MKKNLLRFLVIICSLLFNTSFNLRTSIHIFNHTDVKNNIEYLSSDYFKGRLAGTLENFEVANYIKTQFKKQGLLPFDGNYYDEFDSSYPHRLNEEPYLRILDKKGALIKTYQYGLDYREEMLSFKKNYTTFSKTDLTKKYEDSLRIDKAPSSFIFFVPENNNITFRSSFIASDPRLMSMYIMTSRDTFNSINSNLSKGYKVECFIPFEVKKATMNNVIGYIKGKNPALPPLVISAHFDHVGSDSTGNVYGGALDNASGVSFILELSKYISSLGIPERNIIFAGFNAEEFGCIGSKHFVEKYSTELKGAKVYNFDMIGSSSVPLGIMGGKNDSDSTDFMRSVTSTANSENIQYKYMFEDASDHEAFRNNNIDAVTFCDSDMSKIHTLEDKPMYINTEAIDRCFKVASKEVLKEGFYGNVLLLYYEKILLFSSSSFLLFSLLYMKIQNKNQM